MFVSTFSVRRLISALHLSILFIVIIRYNPFESGCKSTKIFLYYNIFLEKNEKGEIIFDFAFFKLLIIKRLRNHFLFGDVLQRLNEEVPEGLHALDEQGFVG